MKIHECPKCRRAMKVGIAANAKDETIHPWYCDFCDKAWGSLCASKQDAETWAKCNGPLRRVYTGTEKLIRNGQLSVTDYAFMVPCEVCGATGTTEIHHWAPRHLFGLEAESWPMGHLCRKCHVEWHQKVTPNMSKHRRAA